MTDIPVVIGSTGAQETDPATLRQQITSYAESYSPGVTTDLPGTLISDLTGTAVGAVKCCDSARVDTINSLTPDAANIPLLERLGAIYGVPKGTGTNTSAYVQFTGTPGYYIPRGFIVSDETYQYVVQDSTTVPASEVTGSVYVVATTSGSWAVPSGTITELVTSVPSPITLSVTNASAGTPQIAAETYGDYRARVMQAGMVTGRGTGSYIRTAVEAVPGVVPRTVSVNVVSGRGVQVMAVGGDSFEVAGAIYGAFFDPSRLIGSVNAITGVSQTNPATVTTELTHGLSSGTSVAISGAQGMTGINGTWSITVTGLNTFTVGYKASGAPAYTSGGVIDKNPRNVVVSISDGDDTYQIPRIVPLAQEAVIICRWATTASNIVTNDTLTTLGAPAIVNYINTLRSGQDINIYEMQFAFFEAVESAITAQYFSSLVFTVSLDGVEVKPDIGTGVIRTDPQSYPVTSSAAVKVVAA